MKEKENTKIDLILPFDHSSAVTTADFSENMNFSNNDNAFLGYPDNHEDISQNYVDNDNDKKSLKEDEDLRIDTDISIPKPDSLEISEAFKGKDNKKKIKRKIGFLQMRIDSTIYFDNMGYSYQIQNEKNDKKYA